MVYNAFLPLSVCLRAKRQNVSSVVFVRSRFLREVSQRVYWCFGQHRRKQKKLQRERERERRRARTPRKTDRHTDRQKDPGQKDREF